MRRVPVLATALLVISGLMAADSAAMPPRDDLSSDLPLTIASGSPTRIDQVTAGIFHTCALDEPGHAYCWGRNTHGALGQGVGDVFVARWPLPVRTLQEPIKAIAAGGSGYTCVVTAAGAAKCWGNGCGGQLGNGRSCVGDSPADFLEPVDVIGMQQGVTAVVAGFMSTCAVMADGEARCWGWPPAWLVSEPNGIPRTVPGLEGGVEAIAGGVFHFCALMRDAAVRCWGYNEYGELGDGTTAEREEPVPVPGLAGVLAIAAGTGHTCALMGTQGVKCWGDNSFGQLGDGTTEPRLSPVDVVGLTSGVRALTAGGAHTCVVLDTGQAMCWGRNEAGQLGLGTADWGEPHPVPALVAGPLDGVASIAASVAGHERLQYCHADPDPDPGPGGHCPTTGYVCAVVTGGHVRCWGANGEGTLGDGSRVDRPAPTSLFWPIAAAFLPSALAGQ